MLDLSGVPLHVIAVIADGVMADGMSWRRLCLVCVM